MFIVKSLVGLCIKAGGFAYEVQLDSSSRNRNRDADWIS